MSKAVDLFAGDASVRETGGAPPGGLFSPAPNRFTDFIHAVKMGYPAFWTVVIGRRRTGRR